MNKQEFTELNLFDVAERPETLSYSKASGVLLRTVKRSNGGRRARSTLGRLSFDPDGSDLRTIADLTFLTRKRKPRGAAAVSTVRVADLFCGCGAMSVGIAEACRALSKRFAVAAAYDLDPVALNVYSHNFDAPTLTPVDLDDRLASRLNNRITASERDLLKAAGRVDLVIAGPPCQGHSDFNNRTRRTDRKNELYFRVARFAALTEPEHVIIENVATVLHDKARVVQRTVAALESLGYFVVQGFVNLWEIGVPQRRKRHVVVASTNKLPNLDAMISGYRTDIRSTRWAIGDLRKADKTDPMNRSSKPVAVTKRRIDFLFDYGIHDLPDHMRPHCHRTKEHSYVSVYGRMYWDRPAQTITGGFETMGRGRFVHPSQRRTITPREAARLQFIPDFFDFSRVATRRELALMIGNAVPPKLSYVIALELLR